MEHLHQYPFIPFISGSTCSSLVLQNMNRWFGHYHVWFLERTHHNMVNSCQFTCFADWNSNLWHQIIANHSRTLNHCSFYSGDFSSFSKEMDMQTQLGDVWILGMPFFRGLAAMIIYDTNLLKLMVGMGWKHKEGQEDRLAKADGGYVCRTYSWLYRCYFFLSVLFLNIQEFQVKTLHLRLLRFTWQAKEKKGGGDSVIGLV